ncbi:dTDP-4-amino-4,6-dideoxygalactose transaminase [Vibrio crassostreae]|nr:DegT/DnrJ/EryC1/StrS aminotransferase family protein [Vibrio crassostreae]OEF00507.1 UDP-4-amino-4,6-dideoxy-N-acetyl-beta-L-altrosamine transaminase [Vibrio crassostreae 9ZC13]TCN76733.1 dTDP-4-amino-4,6-dideoxygalactose transaminase [Vibrio crassostreae]TWD36539.1 dTDP-4-amino-4,6-dideoxygalactose transaminase [Vibrio crassostreae]TWD66931.1 dTDP-4-amino-4,6-dideoxygalactose transaminase [Vibrio crassostreae]
MNDFLPFALPEIGDEEIDEVVDSLRSGWVTTGPKAKRFEQDFIRFLGDSSLNAIAVNSATSGLHLALEAVGVGPGDEVVVPTYTFTATAEIVRYLGATPIMVDVDVNTFNMTATAFESVITSATKAVIPVHFAGLSCDMDDIIRIAQEYNIFVIEDAAHALPATYNKKVIGSLDSDITVFSFYANKTMTTGEGGMVVTRNEDFASRCRVMRLHGISRDAFDRYVSTKPSWSYEVVAPGYKYNMPDISAAIGIHQLVKLPSFQQKREEMANYYFEKLKDLPITLPSKPKKGDMHAWHLFPIKINDSASITRNRFIELMADLGIGCSVHFIPLHLHPYWRDTYDLKPEMFPVAQKNFEQEVSLPLYTKMTDSDLKRVVDAVRKVLLDE